MQSDGTLSFVQSAASGEFIASAGDSSWGNYSVEADIEINSLGGNAGILFRYLDASNFYMLRLNDTSDIVDLYKKTAGTLQLLTSVSSPISAGQFIRLKASVSGEEYNGLREWYSGTDMGGQSVGAADRQDRAAQPFYPGIVR